MGGVLIAATIIAAAAAAVLLDRRDGGTDGAAAHRPAGERVPARMKALIDGMSIEQKVDTVLALGFEGTDAGAPIFQAVRERSVGGIYIDRANAAYPGAVAALAGEVKAASRVAGRTPPLVITAQEGGRHRQFDELPPAERQVDIGDAGSAQSALDWARRTGVALKSAGVDLNLGPLADVATIDSPIADRSFGDDAAVVAEMTAAAVRGCRSAKILCAVGHFPGQGAASEDTASSPATVSLSRTTLDRRDLAPFQVAIEERVPAVVLSHAAYVAYDPVTPASLSRDMTSRLLRDRLGFRGAAITDDLRAAAVTTGRSVSRAAIEALAAGADLLLISGAKRDQDRARKSLIRAVRDGRVPRSRLDVAAARVLELKRRTRRQ